MLEHPGVGTPVSGGAYNYRLKYQEFAQMGGAAKSGTTIAEWTWITMTQHQRSSQSSFHSPFRALGAVATLCVLMLGCGGATEHDDQARTEVEALYSGWSPGDEGTPEYGTGDLTVLMIVDRSGSMALSWEGGAKWEVAKNALDAAIVGVETTQTLGALFFPDEVGSCTVAPLSDPSQIQFQRADGFQNRWLSNESLPFGSTPLGEAFRQADVAIAEAEQLGLLEERFRVVLISDGEPTCAEDPHAIVAIADSWRSKGIEVEVLGLPGSEAAAQLLNAIAGKVTLPGEAETPPETVWTDSPDGGYVAPNTREDLDDSLHSAIR